MHLICSSTSWQKKKEIDWVLKELCNLLALDGDHDEGVLSTFSFDLETSNLVSIYMHLHVETCNSNMQTGNAGTYL